jgi:hypothetical protein
MLTEYHKGFVELPVILDTEIRQLFKDSMKALGTVRGIVNEWKIARAEKGLKNDDAETKEYQDRIAIYYEISKKAVDRAMELITAREKIILENVATYRNPSWKN